MKNMTNTRNHFAQTGPVVAVPVTSLGSASNHEHAQLDLLSRLTEASAIIRSEAEQIKAIGVSDRSVRLLRILGEAIEEQRLGLEMGFKSETK